MNNSLRKLAVYIHVPFCLRKCGYCDFFSIDAFDSEILHAYGRALIEETKLNLEIMQNNYQIQSIYWGGGTPNLISSYYVGEVITLIKNNCNCADDLEISMEFNPGTYKDNSLDLLMASGINRISLGVQSFNDEELLFLGRLHKCKEIYEFIDELARLGFKNYNIDLIFGIPGQTLISWQEKLSRALAVDPAHISTYLLQLSNEVPLGKSVMAGEVVLPDDDYAADLYEMATLTLCRHGYEQYEISNFAKPNRRCKHNLIYWNSENYLGLGSGAVSFIDACRYKNEEDVNAYVLNLLSSKRAPSIVLEHLNSVGLHEEALILGLRLADGIDTLEFSKKHHIDVLSKYQETIDKYISAGFLCYQDNRLKLEPRAYFISNLIFSDFLS